MSTPANDSNISEYNDLNAYFDTKDLDESSLNSDDYDYDRIMAEKTPEASPTLKTWKPSVSYKYSLRDITEQYTPAEAYRHQLATAGKEYRALQRLEWRWRKDATLWNKCATLVKAGFRGMKGRRYFNIVKEDLKLKLIQRRCYATATEQYYNGDSKSALETIAGVPQMTRDLYVIKFKILYIIQEYEECENSIKPYLEENNSDDTVRYILATTYAITEKYQQAFEELKLILALGQEPIMDEAYLLHAHLCVKLHSNQVMLMDQAVLDFTHLIGVHPEDMNYYLQRANASSCLQDFDSAIEDFTYILYYQPELIHVYCLRARAYACKRMWEEAQKDYEEVLLYYPEDPTALAGMADIIQPYDDLPMIDHEFVEGFVKD